MTSAPAGAGGSGETGGRHEHGQHHQAANPHASPSVGYLGLICLRICRAMVVFIW